LIKSKIHIRIVIGLVCAAVVFFVSFQACGKKGDPVPPRLVPPPAMSDLKASMMNGSINLAWTMPDDSADISRVRILRSDLEIAGDDCPGCPRIYAPVGEMSPRDPKIVREGGRGARYVDAGVKPGRLYTYKVVFCDSYGNCGRDSNTAELKVKE
jgi:hypothetical protein